jgi:acyl homoserine lactone synthase
VITIGGRNELATDVVNSMHAFRHEIFVRRLGWSLPMIEGVERDQYDNEDAIYFIARDPADHITACARLLPTTRQCLLSELAGDLLGHNPPPQDPWIWELSRFATSVRKSGEGRVLSLSQPTLDLLAAIIDFARQRDIKRLVLGTFVAIERLLIRAGFDIHRLAAPRRMPDGLFVVVFIEVHPDLQEVAFRDAS